MNNVVLITDIKCISGEDDGGEKGIEMRFRKKQNDVFYGDTSVLNYESGNISKIS
jgi:hypothetical protein